MRYISPDSSLRMACHSVSFKLLRCVVLRDNKAGSVSGGGIHTIGIVNNDLKKKTAVVHYQVVPVLDKIGQNRQPLCQIVDEDGKEKLESQAPECAEQAVHA